MTKPKLLALTPWVPSERRPRSLGLLEILAETHDVHLLSATWNEEDISDLAALPYPTTGIRFRKGASILRALISLFGRTPLQQGYLSSRKFRRALQLHLREGPPSVVYFNTLRSAHWRRHFDLSKFQSVIDLDEFRSGYYEQVASGKGKRAWRSVAKLEAARMRREEARILESFDRVLVSSPLDMRDVGHLHLVRSPHALPAASGEARIERLAANPNPRICFVGRMSYAANVQAITWFVEAVLPLLREKVPRIVLDIVGDAPTPAVLRLRAPGINVTGRVPSVREYYERSALSIVPVTAATGVQMKLIESLSLGVPTVTTPLVAQQAGVQHGVQVLTASSIPEWIEAAVSILEDSEKMALLSQEGYNWAHSNYSVEKIAISLREAIDCS